MKKLLSLGVILFASMFGANAQTISRWNNSNSNDTITNTTSASRTWSNAAKGTLSIQLDVKKVSGTVGGAAYLEVSIDNSITPVQWAKYPGADTVALIDGDLTKVWSVPASYWHYRVRVVPTGTQKHTSKVFSVLKQ